MEWTELKEKFESMYGAGETQCFQSPGRVNLIGEHTDYNGGYVFPCALSFGTNAVVRKRDDHRMRFASTNFPLTVDTSLDTLAYKEEQDWANYLLGVVDQFVKRGHALGGFDLLLSGNIPNGAGLSSSASIELLMCVALNDLFGCGMEMLEMVKLSQKAENEFVGVNCGILDQFAVGMGQKDKAMFLKCDTIEFEYVPVVLGDYKLVIANTNKRRGLTDSKYNERRAECEKAVSEIQKEAAIQCLGDLSIADFERYKHLISDPVVQKRAQHVVYEDARVLEAVQKLKAGDLIRFGQLMNESHVSLRDLYEVTGAELDALVEEAWKAEGVLGSRMTGGGFGGCTVSIVYKDAIEAFIREVGRNYQQRTGLQADFYIADVGQGAGRYEG